MIRLIPRRQRLLLLDDDPAIQRLVRRLFRGTKYVLDVVSTGAAAIEKIAQRPYDGLLLDVMAPTESGLTVIRYLREQKPAMLARTVLVTGSPDSVLRNVAGEVAGVVRKPFDPERFVATVESLLGA